MNPQPYNWMGGLWPSISIFYLSNCAFTPQLKANISSSHIMVIPDPGSSERISSVDRYLTFILIGGGLQVLILGFAGTGKHALRCPEYRNVEVSNMPRFLISPPGLCLDQYDLFSYDHSFIFIRIYQGKSLTFCQWNSRIPDP